jgi:ATP-dependent protease ClpP protease subunit
MKEKTLKFVKGEIAQGKPANIYFYDDVDYWDVRSFISEFQYLENYVKPSKIRIHIISAGGSCFEGIKAFSVILGSQTPTETINDGLAASMGSVIWAAGKERFMRDYAVLMIHNPRIDDEELDEDGKQAVAAFQKQLKIIYQQRFGFDDEKVQKIMDGEEDVDGTWLFAEDAVEAGIIDDAHVIKSSKEVVAKVAASIDGVKNLSAIGSVMMTQHLLEKQKNTSTTISEKEVTDSLQFNQNKKTMTENEIKMVAAQLGIAEDKATGAAITEKVNALLTKEKQFDSVKAELQTTKESLAAKETELTGCKASIENLTQNLNSVKDELQVYKDKEAEVRNAEITSMVEAAIAAGKIAKESKDTWVKLATDNFELAKQTLDGIAARDKVSAKIANDPANQGAAAEGMKSEEQIVKEKVEAAVGKDFKLLTPNF